MEAETRLKKYLARRKVVWTHVESVSKSGMGRIINAYIISNNEPIRVSYELAQLMDMRFDDKTGGIHISGTGMNMEFALVYNLSSKLYGDGYKVIQRSL